MVQGIGNDIIEVSRIRATISRHGNTFLNKLFSSDEQSYCLRHKDSAPAFAGRFAAKEAVVKALGTGFRDGISWLDIEISHDLLGKPLVRLSDKLMKRFGNPQILISISHCREYAVATAIRL